MMDKPVRILVIEDSPEIQESASLIFELHWPEAVIVQALAGAEGLEKARMDPPDIILLDLGLPDMDGLRVLKELRSYTNVPVMILTVRGEEMDKVRGLEMGADDYVVKPFAHRELLARMRAVLSRQANAASVMESKEEKAPQVTNIVRIDLNTGTVVRNDRPVKLTSTEFNLLKYIAGQNGKTKSETDILANIWGEEYTDCSEYLQVYVKRLREKLEADPSSPRIILKDTEGYRIAAGVI
jgi:two-component system, OmpR family, KDP operon response regulator KdpE